MRTSNVLTGLLILAMGSISLVLLALPDCRIIDPLGASAMGAALGQLGLVAVGLGTARSRRAWWVLAVIGLCVVSAIGLSRIGNADSEQWLSFLLGYAGLTAAAAWIAVRSALRWTVFADGPPATGQFSIAALLSLMTITGLVIFAVGQATFPNAAVIVIGCYWLGFAAVAVVVGAAVLAVRIAWPWRLLSSVVAVFAVGWALSVVEGELSPATTITMSCVQTLVLAAGLGVLRVIRHEHSAVHRDATAPEVPPSKTLNSAHTGR